MTYVCLRHDLLIAKLEAYCREKPSLNLIIDFLRFRKQMANIGSSYSNWANATRGILATRDNLSVILKILGHDMKILSRWLNLNSLKASPENFQSMILGKSLRSKYCLTSGPIKC